MNSGQVHVWYASLDRAQAEIDEFERILSSEETDRARRFHRVVDRERYVVRSGLLRRLLSQYLGSAPNLVEISRDGNGKPYVPSRMNPDNLQFSEADSDNMAAFAFGRSSRLGIDIEKIREFADMLDLVEQHFTQREREEILCCPEDRRLMLFYRLWTRKEAVLKAQGEGLLKGLDSADVASGQGLGPWTIRVDGYSGVEEYSVTDVEGPAGFAVAVAVAGATAEVLFLPHEM